MSVVKVKSYNRGGTKVKAHVRGIGNRTGYVGDCSKDGIKRKFKELKYMHDIPKEFTTGNKVADKIVTKVIAKGMGKLVKNPRGRIVVKATEKVFPYIEQGGALGARIKATWDETCKKRN